MLFVPVAEATPDEVCPAARQGRDPVEVVLWLMMLMIGVAVLLVLCVGYKLGRLMNSKKRTTVAVTTMTTASAITTATPSSSSASCAWTTMPAAAASVKVVTKLPSVVLATRWGKYYHVSRGCGGLGGNPASELRACERCAFGHE